MPDGLSGIIGSAEPVVVASGGATEGPLWHPGGCLTYVRHRESMLMRLDPGAEARPIRHDTGEGNGCTLDRQGRLVMCEGANRQITRMDAGGSLSQNGGPAELDGGYAGWMVPTELDEERWRA